MPAAPHLLRYLSVVLVCSLAAASAAATAPPPEPPVLKVSGSQLEPLTWTDLDGWAADDHLAAFKTFMHSCTAILNGTPPREMRPMANALVGICRRATFVPPSDEQEARRFFEANFRPLRITALGKSAGFLTGYYEPIVEGSRTWSFDFQVPVYRRPSNLVASGRSQYGPNYFPNRGGLVGRRFGRRKIVPYYDRAEIENGVLTGRQLEICWLKDPLDAMFIQIQGSARVQLTDGTTLRLNYDGYDGYPYTPIGKFLIENGAIPRGEMSMERIRQWMQAHPDEAREIRAKNRSYVFFRKVELGADEEPKGAEGVSLTPGRSIAIDDALHVYGTPFFIEADLPIDSAAPNTKFRRLMVGQDTGSAIAGPARADIYFGAGDEAGKIAGRVKQPGRFAMLVPRDIDPFAPGRPPAPLPKPRPANLGQKAPFVPLPRPRPAIGWRS